VLSCISFVISFKFIVSNVSFKVTLNVTSHHELYSDDDS